jgi:hypothetical protein
VARGSQRGPNQPAPLKRSGSLPPSRRISSRGSIMSRKRRIEPSRLSDPHRRRLQVVDSEIARVRGLKAGHGPGSSPFAGAFNSGNRHSRPVPDRTRRYMAGRSKPFVALYRRANIEDGDSVPTDEQPISADRGNLAFEFRPPTSPPMA